MSGDASSDGISSTISPTSLSSNGPAGIKRKHVESDNPLNKKNAELAADAPMKPKAKRAKFMKSKVAPKKSDTKKPGQPSEKKYFTSKRPLMVKEEDVSDSDAVFTAITPVNSTANTSIETPQKFPSKKALSKRKVEHLDGEDEDAVVPVLTIETDPRPKKKRAYKKRKAAETPKDGESHYDLKCDSPLNEEEVTEHESVLATADNAEDNAARSPATSTVSEHSNEGTFGFQLPSLSRLRTLDFTIALPPRVTPWPFKFPQATASYAMDTPCPINWAKYPDLSDEVIRCYVNREPWNPKPKPWSSVARQEPQTGDNDKILSDEGMRKRFKIANQAIFKATGVYFLLSGIGLNDRGVPTDIEMKKLLRESTSGAHNALATGTSTNAALTTDHAGTIATTSTAVSVVPVPRPSKIFTVQYDMFHDEELLFDGPVAGIVLQTPDQDPHATRFMSEAIRNQCIDFKDHVLDVSATAFDLWYTSICFGHRNTLPKRVYKLRRIFNGYTHQDEGMPVMTMATIMETYCLSQTMGTTDVSDMILDHIHDILNQDAQIVSKFHDGKTWEPTDGDVVRFLDLDTKDIEMIWDKTQKEDPVRNLICDVMAHYPGATDIKGNPDFSYPPADGSLTATHYARFSRRCTRDSIISSFAKMLPTEFCEAYHNHVGVSDCYLDEDFSEKSEMLIDKLLEPENGIRKVEHGGVVMTILDETYNSQNDFGALHTMYPHWDWERLRAITTRIATPPFGPKIQELQPAYFELEAMDEERRFPSHPGYQKALWKSPQDSKAEKDKDEVIAMTLKDQETPEGAAKIREDKDTGNVLFDMEDPDWVPPADFANGVERQTGQTVQEFQEHRRWLWKEEGNDVPMVTYKRWVPHNDGQDRVPWDTFVDRKE